MPRPSWRHRYGRERHCRWDGNLVSSLQWRASIMCFSRHILRILLGWWSLNCRSGSVPWRPSTSASQSEHLHKKHAEVRWSWMGVQECCNLFSRTIYEKLASAFTEESAILYRQRVEEISPNIRYCAYNIGEWRCLFTHTSRLPTWTLRNEWWLWK